MKKLLFLLLIMVFPTNAAADKEGVSQQYSLDDLYRIALEKAPQIKMVEEDLYLAEQGKDKARAVLFPKSTAYGNYTAYSQSKESSQGAIVQPDNTVTRGLRLDQSLSLSGREFTALEIAKGNIEKASYDFTAAKEDYLIQVAAAYYDFLRANKALEIAKANIERLARHRDAAQTRLRVGEITKTALLRAEAELSGAQSEEIKAKNSREYAKAFLARLVGLSGDYAVHEIDDAVEGKSVGTAADLKKLAETERADLKALEKQKELLVKQIKYTEGAFWPTVSVEGVYNRRDDDPSHGSTNRESIYGGVTLNFLFSDGGLRKAEKCEAEAIYRKADLAINEEKKVIELEVENAWLNINTLQGIIEKFQDQLVYAEDNYKSVSKQFMFGVANSIDVMDANTLYVTAQRQLSDARYNYQLALLQIEQATGIFLKNLVGRLQ